MAPQALASLKASDPSVYCAAAKAKPASFPTAPCTTRNEPVAGLQSFNEKLATLDSAGDVGQRASIVIGVDGVPLVGYVDATNSALKVARASVLP